ncbi:hypothetical protein IJ596_04225 [bacterium]|nr:hypothetical protein [bacterium]
MDGMRFNPTHDIGLSPKQRAKMQENMDIFRKKGLNPTQKTGHTLLYLIRKQTEC